MKSIYNYRWNLIGTKYNFLKSLEGSIFTKQDGNVIVSDIIAINLYRKDITQFKTGLCLVLKHYCNILNYVDFSFNQV